MSYCYNKNTPRNYGKTKNIIVWENGDFYGNGHVIAINPNYYRTWNAILNLITNILKPSFGAVRNLVHLRSKAAVNSFESLESDGRYVAVGNEKFKDVQNGYKTLAEKQTVHQSQKYHPENVSIQRSTSGIASKSLKTLLFVMANGKTNETPCKVVLTESDFDRWGMMLDYIARSLDIPEGIQHLYTVYGNPVANPREIHNGCIYVAVPSNDTFKNLNYVEIFKSLLPMREIDFKRIRNDQTSQAGSVMQTEVHPEVQSIRSEDQDSMRTIKSAAIPGKILQSANVLADPSNGKLLNTSLKNQTRVIQCQQSTKIYAPYGTIAIQNRISGAKPHCQLKEKPKIYCYNRKHFDRMSIIPFVRAFLLETLNNVFGIVATKAGKEIVEQGTGYISSKSQTTPITITTLPVIEEQTFSDIGSCSDLDTTMKHDPAPLDFNPRSAGQKSPSDNSSQDIQRVTGDKKRISFDDNTVSSNKTPCKYTTLETHKICEKKTEHIPLAQKSNSSVKKEAEEAFEDHSERNIAPEIPECCKTGLERIMSSPKLASSIIQLPDKPPEKDIKSYPSSSAVRPVPHTRYEYSDTEDETLSEISEDILRSYPSSKSQTANAEYCYPSNCGFKKSRKDNNRPVVVQSPKEFIDDIINSSKVFVQRSDLVSENFRMLNTPEFKSELSIGDRPPKFRYDCCPEELQTVGFKDDVKKFLGVREPLYISSTDTENGDSGNLITDKPLDMSSNTTVESKGKIAAGFLEQSGPPTLLSLYTKGSANKSNVFSTSPNYSSSTQDNTDTGHLIEFKRSEFNPSDSKMLSLISTQNQGNIEEERLIIDSRFPNSGSKHLRVSSYNSHMHVPPDDRAIRQHQSRECVSSSQSKFKSNSIHPSSSENRPKSGMSVGNSITEVSEREIPASISRNLVSSSQLKFKSNSIHPSSSENRPKSGMNVSNSITEVSERKIPINISRNAQNSVSRITADRSTQANQLDHKQSDRNMSLLTTNTHSNAATQKNPSGSIASKSILAHCDDIDKGNVNKTVDEQTHCRLCCNPHLVKKVSTKQINKQRSRIMDIPEVREFVSEGASEEYSRSEEVGSSPREPIESSNVTVVKVRNSLKQSQQQQEQQTHPSTSLDVFCSNAEAETRKAMSNSSNKNTQATCYCRKDFCRCFGCIMRFESKEVEADQSDISKQFSENFDNVQKTSSHNGKGKSFSKKNDFLTVSEAESKNWKVSGESNQGSSRLDMIEGESRSSLEEVVLKVTTDRSSHADL